MLILLDRPSSVHFKQIRSKQSRKAIATENRSDIEEESALYPMIRVHPHSRSVQVEGKERGIIIETQKQNVNKHQTVDTPLFYRSAACIHPKSAESKHQKMKNEKWDNDNEWQRDWDWMQAIQSALGMVWNHRQQISFNSINNRVIILTRTESPHTARIRHRVSFSKSSRNWWSSQIPSHSDIVPAKNNQNNPDRCRSKQPTERNKKNRIQIVETLNVILLTFRRKMVKKAMFHHLQIYSMLNIQRNTKYLQFPDFSDRIRFLHVFHAQTQKPLSSMQWVWDFIIIPQRLCINVQTAKAINQCNGRWRESHYSSRSSEEREVVFVWVWDC